jgi:hypothetical protein
MPGITVNPVSYADLPAVYYITQSRKGREENSANVSYFAQ